MNNNFGLTQGSLGFGKLPPLGKLAKTNKKKEMFVSVDPDHANEFDSFNNDLADEGEQSDSDDERVKAKRGRNKEEEEKKPPFMFFDFRKGSTTWPTNVEFVDSKRADELLEKAVTAAEESAKMKKKDGDDDENTNKKESYSSYTSSYTPTDQTEEDPHVLHPDAVFETLKDGSSALVMKPGYRLKLKLNDLLLGGDETKAARLKKEEKEKKRMAESTKEYDVWAGYDSSNYKKYFKEYINEYTITMDLKLVEDPPRDGMSLFQTGLVHSKENKRTGKTTLSRSDGECMINQVGGVGMFGTFGDTTKAKLAKGQWKRVVVAVKCSDKQNEKGELRTWVGSEAGVVLKEESIVANERFAIDPDNLFFFSSAQAGMMPGNIAIRTIRVEMHFSNDSDVKANRALDKLLTKFDEDRKAEVEEQRKGLSLAPLFPKPRPMWLAPAFVANFGDAFIERTTFEGSSTLAWSFTVLNFAIQRIVKQSLLLHDDFNLSYSARVALSDTLHVMQQSAPIFKMMLRMLKTPSESQLLTFLKRLKKYLQALNVGDSLLLPAIVEGGEQMLLLERTSERLFRVVIIQTDAYFGLNHHSMSAAENMPEIRYRTCMVLNDVPKKNALDDVFWMALYNMSIHNHNGDTAKFYDVLVPFLTGKPLEESLVEAETAALADLERNVSHPATEVADGKMNESELLGAMEEKPSFTSSSSSTANPNESPSPVKIKHTMPQMFKDYGPWRAPQCSETAYAQCALEAFYFLLRRNGATDLEYSQIYLCLCLEMVKMMKNDLTFVLPDSNGVRVCSLALRELSHLAVKLIDQADEAAKEDSALKVPDGALVMKEVYDLVENTTEFLEFCKMEDSELPPELDLTGPKTLTDPNDPLFMQYMDLPCWDVAKSDADAGQSVSIKKYVPVDLLQIPRKASTRDEAVTAIRMCDRLCSLIDNQVHCIKSDKLLIAATIEHVFTQVIPVPKPRGVGLTAEELARSTRSQKRADAKQKEEQIKRAEKIKILEEKLLKAESDQKNSSNASGVTAIKNKLKKLSEIEAALVTSQSSVEIKCFGEKIEPDFVPGKEVELSILEQSCIWDQPINYELQVELLLALQRIIEHFAAAAFSTQQSRPFDAVCIVVSGCIAALSDAILRQIAADEPSYVCCHLMGKTISGRQLGHPGYGISVGSFATQSETLEIHSPELSIARTAVLDYFQSPQQRRLDKIFSWEEDFVCKPGKSLIKLMRMVARDVALPIVRPHLWLTDSNPINSHMIKNYPEWKCYRDIMFWWKYFLNPDRKVFRNYSAPDKANELARIMRMEAQLNFTWDDQTGGYIVQALGLELHCRPDPKQTNPLTGKVIPPEQLPTHRFPSTATPSFYVPLPMIRTEDDVIYRPNLPNFEDKYGQVLNQRDSELLISYLTVPYMRIPLLLAFFASEDRIHKLQSRELRLILDSVMFEPGKYLRMDMSNVAPMMVPTPQQDLLATPYGLLINEIVRSPDTVVNSIILLLKGALACDTGSVVDEGAENFNTSTDIIIYVTRLAARTENYISFLIDHHRGTHDCIDWLLRDIDLLPDTLEILEKGRQQIRELLDSQFSHLFEDYLRRLDGEVTKDPNNEKLIDRNSRLACDLHAHKLLLYRNYHEEELAPHIAKALIGSFIYLTTRHTWNKTITEEKSRLSMPETQLYELLQVQRIRLVNWINGCKQGILDEIMQTVLQVSSSLTGSFRTSAEILDNQNRWSRIMGDRSIGRWAVGSTRTVSVLGGKPNSKSATQDSTNDKMQPPAKLMRQKSFENDVGEVSDNGMLGVEIDVQMGQMTLRSKHLSALEPTIANNPDVAMIFGDSTIQASLVERAEFRQRYRLVGLNHELEYWFTAHSICPPLGDEWEREYDPAELFDSEKWITTLFEPVRKSFFNGRLPPPMQFMMTEKATPPEAEVAVLLGLHQKIGGPFKLVYLFRRLRCVHVYECLSHGKEWWYSLHLTTDYRYCLRELQPSKQPRNFQNPEWWLRGAGSPYPGNINDYLVNELDGFSTQPFSSVKIIREEQHHLNLSGGRETLVPSRLLYGVIPDALLDAYYFWQDESLAPRGTRMEDFEVASRGYKRLRGYPKSKEGEYIMLVEIMCAGNWSSYIPTPAGKNDKSCLQSTGFPGRVVNVTRRPKKLVEEDYKSRQKIATAIEGFKLLATPVKKKKSEEDAVNNFADAAFKVDSAVECNYEGKEEYWPCIVRRVNDDSTYDLEYVGDYKWVGLQRGVDPELVQKRGEGEKRKRGEGVWHWEGLSESEDDDWREESDDGSDDDKTEELNKKDRISFYQFDELDLVLQASGWDESVCLSALTELSFQTPTFYEVSKLARAVSEKIGNKSIGSLNTSSSEAPISQSNSEERNNIYTAEDMILMNLLYANRRTRMHSVLKVLSRIENASHICAWTKASNSDVKAHLKEEKGLRFGCPPIDLIELPRLKLAFTARFDHDGILRLYSIDHVDLFIHNDSNASTAKMLSGIPHSLILSNVRGETQVLVPVIPPVRVPIMTEPFSTFIVLDREKIPLAERFFLYPVHISLSFLLTKGLNSALYLMLLRFLHRDYADVFRLADGIATDTKFNLEGLEIFKRYKNSNDDWHPDAHACRMKISLVTMDAGMASPWDLTIECAKHIVKVSYISSSCRLSLEEELQLLESDYVVTSTSSPNYKKEIHDEYSMALCYNRQQQLRGYFRALKFREGPESKAILESTNNSLTLSFRTPPRALSSNWPFYQDNTVFGENYAKMQEVLTAEDGEHSWASEHIGGDNEDPPTGGWLVVAVFHTLWSAGSIKVLPMITELVPAYQDLAHFISLKADCNGIVQISKKLHVNVFPTILILRGGKELERIEGPEKAVEKLVRLLGVHITPEDKIAHAKLRHKKRLEKALALGLSITDEEEKEDTQAQMDWTFDPEQCGESMIIGEDGMEVSMIEELEKDSEVVWEFSYNNKSWKPFGKADNEAIEKCYRSGDLYSNGSLFLTDYELYLGTVVIGDYEITGISGVEYKNYKDINIRRCGDRCPVPNEEIYLSKEQQDRDRRSLEWKDKIEAYKRKIKEQKKGKDIECIRGSIGYLPNTGVHRWSFRWNHEPSRDGKGDAFGICSDAKEEFGAGPFPAIGGTDTGISIGLYADGNLFHNGNVIACIEGTRQQAIDQDTAKTISTSEKSDSGGNVVTSATTAIVNEDTTAAASNNEEKKSSETADAKVKTKKSGKKKKVTIGEEPLQIPVLKDITPKAPLFGRHSIVKCEFDTALDGGTLKFFIDDKLLEQIVLKELYQMIGGSEVFPCICLCPLDSNMVAEMTTTAEAAKASFIQKEKAEKEAKLAASQAIKPTVAKVLAESGNDEEDEEEATSSPVEGATTDAPQSGEKPKAWQEIINFFGKVPSVSLLPHEEKTQNSNSKVPDDITNKIDTSEQADGNEAGPNGDSNESSNSPAAFNVPAVEAVTVPEVKVLEVPIEKIRWMYDSNEEGWIMFTVDASRELEEAVRDGKSEFTLTIGKSVYRCNLDKKTLLRDDVDGEFKMRRHVMGDGLAGMWEILTMRYERQSTLSGQAVLRVLERVWEKEESMSGKENGFGFLFLYSLFSGDVRCRISSTGYDYKKSKGGYMGYGPSYYSDKTGGSSKSSSNDGHRFGLLLTQLYADKHTKSLPASVINVLGRNRQVSLRMPKFKDMRKATQSPFFNGWVDELEPRSPLAELFAKLVPMMAGMKRKGAFHFPPPPPYAELPTPATSMALPELRSSASSERTIGDTSSPELNKVWKKINWDRPLLSDYGCDSRILTTVDAGTVSELMTSIRYRFGADALKPSLPIHVEDTAHFEKLIDDFKDKLFIVEFFASWCNPCKSLAPVFRLLSLKTPTAIFLKVDIDECEELSARFKIEMMPTIIFLRGGKALSNVQGKIVGSTNYVDEFISLLSKSSNLEENAALQRFYLHSPGENVGEILKNITITVKQVDVLAKQPLQDCNKYVTKLGLKELGMDPLDPEMPFDVSQHDAAQTAPATSVLARFKDDVAAFANSANTMPVVKIIHLLDKDIIKFFRDGDKIAEKLLRESLASIKELREALNLLKKSDAQMVQDTIPMLEKAANWIEVEEHTKKGEKKIAAETLDDDTSDYYKLTTKLMTSSKTRFLLNRIAGQSSFVWVEFLFGSLLSSKGEQDLLRLNPYLSNETVTALFSLVTLSMLRANRLGHTNRCIGTVISLESLLEEALNVSSESRQENGKVMAPKIIQLGEELAKTITLARHYMIKTRRAGTFDFDPRYLVFEFVWNIQLRKKQVEIVNDFRDSLSKGKSKVKQMIMGAGKTSVVAPLLALIIADGKSLVLSVVPKALVEMSRTRMRETFAAIMVKRIYTLEFDRSTTVKPSMCRSLENAAANRGVVVATPTTLKSIMLSYVEVLQHLTEAQQLKIKTKIEEYKTQANELAKILKLFKDGVMLLDEVDLILHPLKSELNFPIGDKFDLDGSEEGERWSLPIHLLDAFFYTSVGKVSSFEQRGIALDILKRIASVVQDGIEGRHLQRLPHITLLNMDFYHESLKPVMAEWSYLWLQKQHLHGIDRGEAVRYMLEGAAARSDSGTKVNLLDLAIAKVKVSSGEVSPVPRLTPGHLKSLTEDEKHQQEETVLVLKRQTTDELASDPQLQALLSAQLAELQIARDVAFEHKQLVNEIYDIDEQIEERTRSGGRKLGEIQGQIIILHKQITSLECPRDDSMDNSIVVWCSQAFAAAAGASVDVLGASTGESSVHSICTAIEDLGLSVRRCSEPEEAISRARDLQLEGMLRCVIIGGDEKGANCGPSCVKKHTGHCVKCGESAAAHFGHECSIGGRGSFSLNEDKLNAKTAGPKLSQLQIMKTLTDSESAYSRTNAALPSLRTAVYAAHTTITEEERMEFWKLGSTVTDDSKQLVQWITTIPAWNVVSEDESALSSDAVSSAPKLTRQTSITTDKEKLAALKAELEELEQQKTSKSEDEENMRKAQQVVTAEKNASLQNSVDNRIGFMTMKQAEFNKIISDLGIVIENSEITKKLHTGPHSSRDAALGIAWLDVYGSSVVKKYSEDSSSVTEKEKENILKHLINLNNELAFLRQMALAAKVVAHVTSPTHKKLLNLCHNWLSTFLPHCLAKINRVSFGLLTSEDCKAALLLDPHVPRSRLRLAVPFVGKDVPSKSSEFAHPDVIIGLTVLAYRYSGLRKDDFVDIVDGLTSQFTQEIGPARDRESSQRHEKWVLAAGGAIRGLKMSIDGQPWAINPETASQDDLTNKEVVQLKFLQKSNKEQMDKLFELLRYEPLAIHYYLQKSIFPLHMRSQKMKISASGQSVGGDMLVGKRVGFSGTPSDLLPQELGRCDYETGDDGMMLMTCLDRNVASYEYLQDKWTVEIILERIATAENPRYHALIDTGALITGYSNQEVAQQLLDRGLTWCEGVVFLDDEDRQQVLVRATGRVVSADQCGVALEHRFAFYDQIHTTGMDIKHVVNATAIITLGKDMVFRDYVQGAYRMRGIGIGQKIHIYVIPEVQELMQRELREAIITRIDSQGSHVLEDIVAWLIINSLRSEQTQWTMLCLQNIGNLYRKNAFNCVLQKVQNFTEGQEVTPSAAQGLLMDANLSEDMSKDESDKSDMNFADSLDRNAALKVFDESIDFSLEAGVPDPLPFEEKLRSMLENHEAFIQPHQHAIGHSIMQVVGQFSMIEGSANRLDTEQEREQEQEQEKEVEARREEQVEVEKFVDREFSRQEEVQRPWPFSILSKPITAQDHPFYPLKDFKLRHHEPLEFPPELLVSSNYFNPNWTGLRRVKNVVMILEYAPDTSEHHLRLKVQSDYDTNLSESQRMILKKAHTLLGFHASANGHPHYLSKADLYSAIKAATDFKPSDELLESILERYSQINKPYMSFEEFLKLMTSGELYPAHNGRYWVALSLAEAETIRRILHIRKQRVEDSVIPAATIELALRYNPIIGSNMSNAMVSGLQSNSTPLARDGGVVFDASWKWYRSGTSATAYECGVAHSCWRFFDCDMHFSKPALNILVKVLKGSIRDRERFFQSTVACRRRLERKTQDTPLSKVFVVPDEWVALKQQAQAVFINEALKARKLTLWEAFTAIDYDNNGMLSPSEFYGALLWLGVPELTAEDVVDFIESADKNRDGMVDYREYMEMLSSVDDRIQTDENAASPSDSEDSTKGEDKVPIAKVEPYGAEELREIMIYRKQMEQQQMREERMRKQAYHDALDVKVFEEELEASRLRKGGANPKVLTSDSDACVVTDFNFALNQYPLRFVPTGKNSFIPIHLGTSADPPVKPMQCSKNHVLQPYPYYWMNCTNCRQKDTQWVCWTCYVFFCSSCYEGDRRMKEMDRRDPSKHPTFLRCLNGCSFTLQIPVKGGADPVSGDYTLCMDVRFDKPPPKGQLQSLLRFSLPDISQTKKIHRTSVYLNGDGVVVGRPIESGVGEIIIRTIVEKVAKAAIAEEPIAVTGEEVKAVTGEEAKAVTGEEAKAVTGEEAKAVTGEEAKAVAREEAKAVTGEEAKAVTGEEAKAVTGEEAKAVIEANQSDAVDTQEGKAKEVTEEMVLKTKTIERKVRVRGGFWCVLTVAVKPSEGLLETYVNGELCHVSKDLDPSDLRLHHKLVVFGGGKQAHVKGGDIRRLVIYGKYMDAADVMKHYCLLANDNPGFGCRLAKIQALYRGFHTRRLKKEEVEKS